MKTLLLRIHGRVQGVGYRDAMCTAAMLLGARGWVRNRRDGTVEALIEANDETCDALVRWAQRGSPAAQVERVDQRELSRTERADYPQAGSPFQRLTTT